MSLAFLHCAQPIRRRLPFQPRDYARRDRAIELFEAQQYHDALRETLIYLLQAEPAADLRTQPLCLVQGSARVHLRQHDDALDVRVVLAALNADSQATAALRYVLSRLSATGQLHQPRLRDGLIQLEYREQLALLHPLKLIEVLQRLPVEADRNDSWLADAFNLEMRDREPIAPLSDDEFERAEAVWTRHWSAVDELVMESRRRRSLRFLDAVGAIALNQARYTLPMHGIVRARLYEGADTFNDREESPNKRDAALAKTVKEMRQIDRDTLRRCLGHAHYSINPLQEGTPAVLNATLGAARMQVIGELRTGGRAMEAAVLLIADHCDLLAYYCWPAAIDARLREALDLASDRPWREAAELLWNHAHGTVKLHGTHGEQEEATADGEPRYVD